MNDSLSNIFATNIRIHNMSCFAADAVWPQGIEIAIFRVPVRKRDGFSSEMIEKMAVKLKAHMAINGIAFLICYAPQECKSRPFEIADTMVKQGFNHIDNIVIEKSWLPGKRSETNLVNSYEYVLYFCNGNVWKLDRYPIRKYLKTPEEVSCPGNLWKVEVGSLDDAYPNDLAELLIAMTDCLPGSLCFDPFMSTAASLKASLKLGHSFTGFETDPKKIIKYEKIIKDFQDKR
jgi:DNA modification methylase